MCGALFSSATTATGGGAEAERRVVGGRGGLRCHCTCRGAHALLPNPPTARGYALLNLPLSGGDTTRSSDGGNTHTHTHTHDVISNTLKLNQTQACNMKYCKLRAMQPKLLEVHMKAV